jgi:uncharacterized protein
LAPVLAFAAVAVAAATPVPAKPTQYATDRAGVVPAARLAALNERLAAFDRETSNQILVVVDRRLPADTTLEEMGVAALRAWGVGQKGRDNGAIFFVFVDERAMRIEVGYGLEGAIPDIAARRITDGVVKPFFRRNDYAGGIEAGAEALMSAARREGFKGTGAARPRPQPRPAMKAKPRPAPGISFAAFWAMVGRTLAIGAAIAAVFLVAFRFVSRQSVREEAALYARTFMAAWGTGVAAVAALQGDWIFAGIAFVLGLLFVIEYRPSGDGASAGSYSSSSDYSSSSSYSSPSSSYESPSSSSNFSGGGGDGGGGGSSDRW